ncbi:MAG TPA: hypothetical protein VMU76_11300 [Acidimicrobiales bacterium]|nr:hypothetical protein [Acidimicrobiales bacterium]
MAKDQKQQESEWDRVYRDVEESRRSSGGKLPDPKQYKDLTKSAGSKK